MYFFPEILKLVLAGRMGEAIEMTGRLYPGLLERNQNLLFLLKCRQFVEMVNGTDSEVCPPRCPRGPYTMTSPPSSPARNGLSKPVRSRSNSPSVTTSSSSSTTTSSTTNNSGHLTSAIQTSVIQSTKSYQQGSNNRNDSNGPSVEELNLNNVAMNGTSAMNDNVPVKSTDSVIKPISTGASQGSDVEMESEDRNCNEKSVSQANGYQNGTSHQPDEDLDEDEEEEMGKWGVLAQVHVFV